MQVPGFLPRAVMLFAAIGMSGPVGAQDLRLRVVDVGNGLCVVAAIPGGHSLLYDAGDKGDYCLDAVRELVTGNKIDLIILSHSDSDHIGELPHIVGLAATNGQAAVPAAKSVGTIVFPGDQHISMTETIRRELASIDNARVSGATVWSLAAEPLPEPDPQGRRTFHLGEAAVTIVAGWSNGDDTAPTTLRPLPTAEHNNAVSIVAHLTYHGHSVLLTGDTVGKLLSNSGNTCRYAEKIMRDRASEWPIESDVLIGQHHGGNTASTNCFIRAVKPKFVVFSAGHKNYHHPSQKAADRIRLTAQISPDAMLRTDLGDDEGGGEWVYKSIAGCVDKPGDDDVEVILPDDPAALVTAQYLHPHSGC